MRKIKTSNTQANLLKMWGTQNNETSAAKVEKTFANSEKATKVQVDLATKTMEIDDKGTVNCSSTQSNKNSKKNIFSLYLRIR